MMRGGVVRFEKSSAGAVRASIELGTMPPWKPDEACTDYDGNIDLTADEKETLLAWLDAELPKGDPRRFCLP